MNVGAGEKFGKYIGFYMFLGNIFEKILRGLIYTTKPLQVILEVALIG
jgi:hypothetical protein